MEMKVMSFLLPFLLLVTTRAMAPPPVESHGSHPLIMAPPAAHSPEKPHHHAPAHSPEKPHFCHHGPGKAPCHDPEKRHHHHAPGKAPFHSPENYHYRHAHGPIHPPVLREGTPFPNRKPDCPKKCGKYCKKDDHRKREKEECVKACTVCCKKFECVPREHNKKCKWSSEVKMGGETVKCPR